MNIIIIYQGGSMRNINPDMSLEDIRALKNELEILSEDFNDFSKDLDYIFFRSLIIYLLVSFLLFVLNWSVISFICSGLYIIWFLIYFIDTNREFKKFQKRIDELESKMYE